MYTVSSVWKYILSLHFVKFSIPVPVQHQKLSKGVEYTLKNPVAIGWKYIVIPVSGFWDDIIAFKNVFS